MQHWGKLNPLGNIGQTIKKWGVLWAANEEFSERDNKNFASHGPVEEHSIGFLIPIQPHLLIL